MASDDVGLSPSNILIAARIKIKNKEKKIIILFFPGVFDAGGCRYIFVAFSPLEVPSATPLPRAL